MIFHIRIAGVFSIAIIIMVIAGFRLSDTLTPFPMPELRYFPPMPDSPDNPLTVAGVSLGRFLFYDPILSADSSFSCSSCHHQERAFSDSPNRFSKGIYGDLMTRNTMALFNLQWYPAFFWDGKAATLEKQVFHPVREHDEMNFDWTIAAQRISRSWFYSPKFRNVFGNEKIDSVLIAKAIAQFERTLLSYNSKYDSVLRGEAYFTHDEYEGFVLMHDQTKGDCLHCHSFDADALGTTAVFSNNGLDQASKPDDYIDKGKAGVTGDSNDIGKFIIPSLRNVAVTAPYMHDGRFMKLEEVLDFYSEGVNLSGNIDPKMEYAHQGGVHLSKDEKSKIIAFLLTLTDSTFLTNRAFGNPFVTQEK